MVCLAAYGTQNSHCHMWQLLLDERVDVELNMVSNPEISSFLPEILALFFKFRIWSMHPMLNQF